MNVYELSKRLNDYGLNLKLYPEGKIGIGSPNFANPLLWMDSTVEHTDYEGSVRVKSINASLFTGEQIKISLMLADSFMQTPISERELGE